LDLIRLEDARGLPGRTLVVERDWLRLFPEALLSSPDAGTLGQVAAGRDEFTSAERLEPVTLRAVGFVKAPPPRATPPLGSRNH
jgi:hypothetical protein